MKSAQQLAAKLTDAQRRVLFVLERNRRPMTCDHIDDALQLHCASDVPLRYPSQTLRALLRKHLLITDTQVFTFTAEAWSYSMYALTTQGRLAARYCYSDGGYAHG